MGTSHLFPSPYYRMFCRLPQEVQQPKLAFGPMMSSQKLATCPLTTWQHKKPLNSSINMETPWSSPLKGQHYLEELHPSWIVIMWHYIVGYFLILKASMKTNSLFYHVISGEQQGMSLWTQWSLPLTKTIQYPKATKLMTWPVRSHLPERQVVWVHLWEVYCIFCML